MWGDAKFRALSAPPPNARDLWVYLVTGPHNGVIPGLFAGGEAALAEALEWPLEAFRECFAEISAKGMAKADWKARLVWLPNAARHNLPASPNVVVGWGKAFDELPECALKREAFAGLQATLGAMPEGFRKAFRKAFGKPHENASPKGLPNQEQEQEQEQDTPDTSTSRPAAGPPTVAVVRPPDPPPSAAPPAAASSSPSSPDPPPARGPTAAEAREVFAYWQRVMGSPRSVLDAKRERVIRAALARHGLAECKRAIDGCFASDWHMNRPDGGNERGKKFNDVELILRDAKHVEDFVAVVRERDEARAAAAAEKAREVAAHEARAAAPWRGVDPRFLAVVGGKS